MFILKIYLTYWLYFQLTVYNHKGGPCYRCLFPHPPPPETVTNCSDGGVVGVGKFVNLFSFMAHMVWHLLNNNLVEKKNWLYF